MNYPHTEEPILFYLPIALYNHIDDYEMYFSSTPFFFFRENIFARFEQ